MKLKRLISVDIYRDGGSYRAAFETDEGDVYSLWLQRSGMPDAEGLHHRWLFAYFGEERPEHCPPVVTGSTQERQLMAGVNNFLNSDAALVESGTGFRSAILSLKKMIDCMVRREPCLPSDLSRFTNRK